MLRDATRGDRRRTSTECPSVEALWQARSNENVVIGDPAARPEDSSAGPQHGELGAYSSERVSVYDAVERSTAEGKGGAPSKGEVTAASQFELFGARMRSSYRRERYVGDYSPATASFCEV